MAALAMQKALEVDAAEPQWRAERDRLMTTIPEQQAALLQVGLHAQSYISPILHLQNLCIIGYKSKRVFSIWGLRIDSNR